MNGGKTIRQEPFVVISILNWVNYTDTINCINSLKQLNYANYKIIIRDNASPNDSYHVLKKTFPELQIELSSENNGFAAGHYQNYLIAKQLDTELFWILNSDLEIDKNSLNELVEKYLEHGNHLYGSVSLNPKNLTQVDFGGAALRAESTKSLSYNSWKHKLLEDLIKSHPHVYEVESIEGSSMLIPMQVIEKYGFLKLDFFMYAEETDYCYCLRKSGIKSYVVTSSYVHHHNEGSTQQHPKLKIIPIYYRRRNALRFSIEHLGLSRWQALSYQNGACQNLKTVIKGLFSKKKELHYFYALGCLHACLGIKGRKIMPEKLIYLNK